MYRERDTYTYTCISLSVHFCWAQALSTLGRVQANQSQNLSRYVVQEHVYVCVFVCTGPYVYRYMFSQCYKQASERASEQAKTYMSVCV